jgi:hypothetical protein
VQSGYWRLAGGWVSVRDGDRDGRRGLRERDLKFLEFLSRRFFCNAARPGDLEVSQRERSATLRPFGDDYLASCVFGTVRTRFLLIRGSWVRFPPRSPNKIKELSLEHKGLIHLKPGFRWIAGG